MKEKITIQNMTNKKTLTITLISILILSAMLGPMVRAVDIISLDSEYYHVGSAVTVTVTDAGMNIDHLRKETVTVYATSDTDTIGIEVTLTETGVNTGIFRGSFPLVPSTPEPGVDELGVSEDDTIYVEYVDEYLGSHSATATVDDTAPEFDSVTGPEFCKNTDTITLTATLDEEGYTVKADFSTIDSECTAKVTATDNTDNTYTIIYEIDEENTRIDGAYIVTVTAEDLAGNTETDTVTITLDNTGPSVTDAEADPSLIQPGTETDVTFTATVSDSGSGVESVTIDLTEIDGAETQEMTETSEGSGVYEYTWTDLSVDLEDDYVLPITATDTVGNTNTESIILHVVDDTEGPIDVSFTEAEPICGGLIVKGLTAEDPLSGVREYEIYVGEDELDVITVGALESTTWTDGLYKGTFVLDLSAYVDTTVEVTVVAVDYAGNTADPVTLFEGKVPKGEWYGVELYKGWNLVSLPLIPDSDARGDILSLILDQGASGVVVSYGYDQHTDTWITNPTKMTDGYGYWIYAKDYDVMIVEGVEILGPPSLPATYEFTAGWVLAGYKQIGSHALGDYLESLETSSYFTTVYVWNAETPTWSTLSTTGDLAPGQGFWIWMYSDQNLIPPMEVS